MFEGFTDPCRATLNRRHLRTDTLTLATCAVIAGADTWDDVAAFGQIRQEFIRRFRSLPNGVPSPDTFVRVFARSAAAFAHPFGRWMAVAWEAAGFVPVAINGKSARGAKAGTATGCLHLVRAWARPTASRPARWPSRRAATGSPSSRSCCGRWTWGAIVTLDAAGRTSGSQRADRTFALAAGNTNPQDIADPPPEALPAVSPVVGGGAVGTAVNEPPADRIGQNTDAALGSLFLPPAPRAGRPGAGEVAGAGTVRHGPAPAPAGDEPAAPDGASGADWAFANARWDGVKSEAIDLSASEFVLDLAFILGL